LCKLGNESFLVCMTNQLALRYPEVYWPIRINLEARGIEVKTVYRTENIWIRDYFPIQINGEYFRFRHKTSKKFPQLDISNEPWTGVFAPIRCLPYFIDGGNIVQGYGKVILTEKVIQDNESGIVNILEKLFESEIIIVPIEPGDPLGHSDGVVRFIDKNHVLVNDYFKIAQKDKNFYAYQTKLEAVLNKHGLIAYEIPNAYDQWNWKMSEKEFRQFFPRADEYNPAFGYYINYLKVSNVLFLPAMKIARDVEAYNAIKTHFSECDIIMIDCSRLSFEGGLIHCVTWNGVK